MANWGKTSQARLDTCHPHLVQLCDALIGRCPFESQGFEINDLVILAGHRIETDQNEAVRAGHSRTRWPNSMHNRMPSLAVDIAVYHPNIVGKVDWKNADEFEALAAEMLATANEFNINLRWGGDWDRDGIRVDNDPDESLMDGPHFELVGYED